MAMNATHKAASCQPQTTPVPCQHPQGVAMQSGQQQGVLHELLGGLTTGPASNTPAADLATAVLAGAQWSSLPQAQARADITMATAAGDMEAEMCSSSAWVPVTRPQCTSSPPNQATPDCWVLPSTPLDLKDHIEVSAVLHSPLPRIEKDAADQVLTSNSTGLHSLRGLHGTSSAQGHGTSFAQAQLSAWMFGLNSVTSLTAIAKADLSVALSRCNLNGYTPCTATTDEQQYKPGECWAVLTHSQHSGLYATMGGVSEEFLDVVRAAGKGKLSLNVSLVYLGDAKNECTCGSCTTGCVRALELRSVALRKGAPKSLCFGAGPWANCRNMTTRSVLIEEVSGWELRIGAGAELEADGLKEAKAAVAAGDQSDRDKIMFTFSRSTATGNYGACGLNKDMLLKHAGAPFVCGKGYVSVFEGKWGDVDIIFRVIVRPSRKGSEVSLWYKDKFKQGYDVLRGPLPRSTPGRLQPFDLTSPCQEDLAVCVVDGQCQVIPVVDAQQGKLLDGSWLQDGASGWKWQPGMRL